MEREERLARLRTLRVERGNGPLFGSSAECMEWIDNVAPLLKYDADHYKSFIEHAEYVRITQLSSDLIMAHLNPMIGIVNQAIIELENNIEPVQQSDKKLNGNNIDNNWHNKPMGKLAIGVLVVVLGAGAIWILNYYFGFGL